MVKLTLVVFTILFFHNCSLSENRKETSKTTDQLPIEIIDFKKLNIDTIPLEISYLETCQKIKKEKYNTDSLSIFLEEVLINKIFPFWYGTPWDFNGHTDVPNEGNIACGYFVSTTLKHLGFNLNRYKLAQQLPIHEAKTLSVGEPILKIKNDDFEICLEKIKTNLSNGIYFVGLDVNHVGFLLKRKKHLLFIHANYGSPAEVIIENAAKSPVLNSFRHFYIAKVSTNLTLLEYWKTGKEIPIITK